MPSGSGYETEFLTAAWRRLLVQHPFVPGLGTTLDMIDAVHVEDDWPSFGPVTCPLNTRIGYCAQIEPLQLLSPGESLLFPITINQAMVADATEDDPDELADALDMLKTRRYVAWFIAAWKSVRDLAADMQGFLSIHDTIWCTDLDSGDEFRNDSGWVKF